MNKKMHRIMKQLAVVLSLALLVTGINLPAVKSAKAATDKSAAFATVKTETDFRRYIDNGNPYSAQDTITTDWKGTTDTYKLDIPADGTLLVYCLSDDGYVKAQVYSDFALTMLVGETNANASDRDELKQMAVKAGTYYFRGSRWNGTGDVTATTYVGFIPNATTGVTYSDTSTKYDTANNVTVKEVASISEFTEYVKTAAYASTDTITTKWSGESTVHSFTVQENGWVLIYPIAGEEHVNFRLYSNATPASKILEGKTMKGITTDPYACYLTAGTYYYKGSRWNGYEPITFNTYIGFIKDSSRFSLVSNINNAANTAACVTFSGSGLIRVTEGQLDPANVTSETFWKTTTRENALQGTSITLKKNGTYVARLETADGKYPMIEFTVSGLTEKAAVNDQTDKGQTPVYKVKAAKKTITVKVKKKAKIKYTVTKGYTGKVKFTSSNKKIATVSSKGVVTGKKKGTCKITLKLNNGKKAVVTVKVKKK